MKKLVLLITSLTFFIQVLTAYAQNIEIDSLENLLQQNTINDTQRVDLLNSTAYKLRKFDVNKVFKYAKEAEQISDSLNYLKGKAESIRITGIGYYEMYDYTNALQYFQKSLLLNKKLHNKNGIAKAYTNIGNVYYYQNDFNIALNFYLASLILNKELSNKNETAYSLYCIGWAYKGLLDYDKLYEYFQKALT